MSRSSCVWGPPNATRECEYAAVFMPGALQSSKINEDKYQQRIRAKNGALQGPLLSEVDLFLHARRGSL